MDLKDFNFWAIVAYLLPGLLIVQARSFAAKARLAPVSKDGLIVALCLTVLYGLAMWGSGFSIRSSTDVAALASPEVIRNYVIFPVAIGFFFGLLERWGIIRRLLLPLGINSPLPFVSVWVELFPQIQEGTYLIVTLKDGTVYNVMVTRDTRFGSDPTNADAYFGQTYSLADWTPAKPQRGVYVRASEIRTIEIFRS